MSGGIKIFAFTPIMANINQGSAGMNTGGGALTCVEQHGPSIKKGR